jgi:hypothetical protein
VEQGLRLAVGLCLLPVLAWVAALCVTCELASRCRRMVRWSLATPPTSAARPWAPAPRAESHLLN